MRAEPDDFNPQSPEPPRPVSPDSADSNDISQCLAEGSVQQSCPAPPGPDDISQSRADGPVQPVLKVFPKTQHGSRKRAFIETWRTQTLRTCDRTMWPDDSFLSPSCAQTAAVLDPM
ncbi:hypothetical protein UPYG_G00135450 [Umbra pygmaea]|uniref:Uncharacterized protein n=1 Tax=Umbra pygmaea TaxID=75934 RepID=A0ABD0XCH0_UMBPY